MAGKLNVPTTAYASQLRNPYNEYISPKGWVGSGSAAHGPGLVLVHTFQVPWPSLAGFIKDALGYSTKNGGFIQRKLPWNHPHFTILRATRVVDIQGVHWIGQSGGAVAGNISDYDIARVTISFESLPYAVLDAGEITGEWDRFVIYKGKPQAEYLSRDGYTWVFTEGPSNGKKYPGFAGVPITRKRLAWTWVQVPADYILDGNGKETNLLKAVNNINNAQFPPVGSNAGSYPAQTLLFEDYDLEPRMEPFDVAGILDDFGMPISFDVTLYFTYFDPGLLGVLGGGAANNGWNNDPSPIDGLWYHTAGKDTRPGGAVWTTKGKFQTTDFTKIFSAA